MTEGRPSTAVAGDGARRRCTGRAETVLTDIDPRINVLGGFDLFEQPDCSKRSPTST